MTTSRQSQDRSWWGWGSTKAALSHSEVAELTERVRLLAPDHDFTDHPPPDPGDLEVPEPRVTPPDALSGLCSPDATDRLSHARGKAFRDVVRNLQGDITHVPDLVAYPNNEQDVTALLDWCSEAEIAVIPYGGGSSVVGGVEPRFDGPAISLDTSRMRQVLEVDPTSRAARIQAGAYGPDLEAQLREHALTLRHFPQSLSSQPSAAGWPPEPVATSPPSTPTSTISPSRSGWSPQPE